MSNAQRRKKGGAASNDPSTKQATPTPAAPKASIWAKALRPGAAWTKETFPEFPDVVYWLRQVLALVVGVLFGLIPVKGFIGITGFFVVVGGGMLYYSSFAKVSEDSFLPSVNLMSEGLAPALGVFLVAWTMTYTACHTGPQLAEAANAAIQAAAEAAAAAEANTASVAAGGGATGSDSAGTPAGGTGVEVDEFS